MRASILLTAGLVAGLVAQEAHALCLDGATSACTTPQGCPGEKTCDGGYWSACEATGAPRSCTRTNACNTYTGTQACGLDGIPFGSCNVAEVCNGCDEDLDGQVDEGLSGCNGVVCGSMFERCGDNLDNDCDGSVNEGCAGSTTPCTSSEDEFPFVFNSQNELKKATNALSQYSDDLDAKWKFIPSHRMSHFGFVFDKLNLEENLDFFRITPSTTTTSLTGELATMFPFFTSLFALTPGTMPTLRFESDVSLSTTEGAQISDVQAKCNDGGGSQFYSMNLNEGADGVLLHTDDNAYFSFYLPADREVFINMDHDFGPNVDFDMFVTTSGTTFGTSPSNSTAFSNSVDTTGDLVHLAASSSARLVKVNIVSFSGAGRFRIFLASPVVQDEVITELAFSGDVAFGSTEDLRMKSEWADAQRYMMRSTDGQFRIRPEAYVSRDVWCETCYDVVFRDSNDLQAGCSGGCSPACATTYIAVAASYWSHENTYMVGNDVCNPGRTIETVARTLVHEWGHYDFGMWHEERGDDANGVSRNQCGWSIMAGSSMANNVNHFEWCDAAHHLRDPEFGAPEGGYDDNWAYIIDEYPEMSDPEGSGDFSQMRRLGKSMRNRNFVTFTEN